MKFIFWPVTTIVICQFIKLLILFFKQKQLTFKKIIWEGFWAGKFPSSHAAVLTSGLFLVTKYGENPSFIIFAYIVSVLFVYSLLEDKKRHQIQEAYFLKSQDSELKKITTDGVLAEFNGHTLFELFAGVLIGLVVSVFLDIWL